jgi:hypothetical protein
MSTYCTCMVKVVFAVMVGVSVGQVVEAAVVTFVTLLVITQFEMLSLLLSYVTDGVIVTVLPEMTDAALLVRASVGVTMSMAVSVTVTFFVIVNSFGRTDAGS